MRKQLLMACALSIAALGQAWADEATKVASHRYAEDKKLCAEESSSSARMQCLRDAKAEYNKALAAAKATKASSANSHQAAAVCAECGRVVSVNVVEKKGKSSPLGMIAGGVAGAVLGHQVGQGTGKDLATVAGAAGGAYAGHKIEENVKATKSWVVKVRFDNGEERNFNFASDPGYASGDLVKSSGSGLVRR
jgi:outer membrane lipoprotein SlyB